MTTMIIDNKATAKKAYESYAIDREEYPTIKDLVNLVDECMNDNVYMIKILVDGVEVSRTYNNK